MSTVSSGEVGPHLVLIEAAPEKRPATAFARQVVDTVIDKLDAEIAMFVQLRKDARTHQLKGRLTAVQATALGYNERPFIEQKRQLVPCQAVLEELIETDYPLAA